MERVLQVSQRSIKKVEEEMQGLEDLLQHPAESAAATGDGGMAQDNGGYDK